METIARPGDTVIIGLTNPIDEESRDEILREMRNLIPPGIKVVLIDSVASMVVVRNEAVT